VSDLVSPALVSSGHSDGDLTDEQERIVSWEDGPLVVIAGAGTGKTRVIVERVRRLLETKGAPHDAADASTAAEAPATVDPLALPAEAASADPDDSFAGPLLPEQILVLTYNVKAAKELADRLEKALGPAVRARLAVANFHSFCHRILVESAPDAGLPSMPDVLDGVGQVLLLRDLRPGLPLLYYSGRGNPFLGLDRFVAFINRAKDELVSPDDFDAYLAAEQAAFEGRYGPYDRALERLEALGSFDRGRNDTRGAYASFRATERAAAAENPAAENPAADPNFEKVEKIADREARRAVWGTGYAISRGHLTDEQREAAEHLAATYVADGAALEVLRLSELALVYRAYEAERERRGALDFGEQVAAVIRLFRDRPNVLRRWQRRFRYLLVDEFQDANVAQVELIELLGRTPDRPDNVMVVGDDDQSIYRFRGASYAAFVEFDRRFADPPAHDSDGPAPGQPTRLSIVENFRSRPPILVVANRLISRNELRYMPDKRLAPHRTGDGANAVELLTCAGPDDEAAAIVERIRDLAGWDPATGGQPVVPWSSFAVLYRKHKHRDAIVARLREESIPYTVSGGLSLFATPEIRDLEQALRALADPFADVALARTLTAGPWRLDALELLAITRAASRAKRHLLELIREAVGTGEVTLDALPTTGPNGSNSGDGTHGGDVQADATDPAPETAPPDERVLELAPATRAKLRRLLDTLDELVPETPREGPFTILERYIERTGMLLDLLAADTLESKRAVANVASLMRFAADWQREHATSTLCDFVNYLDAYQSAGGELPTSVELAEDAQGVGLMTLYQAKGLEYDHVFVPHLLEGEWPVRERDWGLFPRELLREAVPVGDLHTEEERRLLYVAITRARETLTLSTHGGPTSAKAASAFVAELRDEAGLELVEHDRTAALGTGTGPGTGEDTGEPTEGASGAEAGEEADPRGALERIVALPSPRERRSALRLRAAEVLSLLEGVAPDVAEAEDARTDLLDELGRLGASAVAGADAARAAGLDPLTLRTVAAEAGVGANLLAVAPLPGSFSFTQFDRYERCPLRYALQHVYRVPTTETVAAFTFGSTAHAAFEAFTKERRERAARGDPPPTREDLGQLFAAEWKPTGFPDATSEQTYRRRTASLLDNFWDGELASVGMALHEELGFELRLDPGDGSPVVRIGGSIDRIDRLPSGGIEILDYKTGKPGTQKTVDESLQLSIYALACRDTLGLGTPERVTLYYTEAATRMSTTRTDDQLDAAREELLALAAQVRSGDFHATPSPRTCGWCDYRAICPSRAE
jgi:DNA helicase-2/ATP-dependent DNA helicase PcrA